MVKKYGKTVIISILSIAVILGLFYVLGGNDYKKDLERSQSTIDSLNVEFERIAIFRDSLIQYNQAVTDSLRIEEMNIKTIRNEKVIIIDRTVDDALRILAEYDYDARAN